MGRFSDVLIVGGGAIGGALAWSLARRGVSVTLVEAGPIGRGASWAAAGVLAPDWSAETPPALSTLAVESLAAWPDWVAELEEQTGTGLNFRKDGLLNVWVDPDAPHLPADLAVAPPPTGTIPTERLSAAEVHALEPVLTGPVAGAILSTDDAQVDNPRLAPALLRAATTLGARVLTDTSVAALLGSAGRCTGVRTARGEAIAAGAVVLAAGAWSGPLAAASGITLPIVPWRGQMLAFDAVRRPLRHIVFCGELVLIPRPHGPLLVGTTLEDVGFDARVTLSGLSQILARASRVVPGLGDLPLVRTWAGLRPGTPDHLPYLGPVPGWEGLYAATGHGRKGIILAPITGELIARLILEDAVDPRLLPFLPGRIAQPGLEESEHLRTRF
jgi:glycine oxidase